MKITGIVKPTTFVEASDLATKTRQVLRKKKLVYVEKDGIFRGMIDRTAALQILGNKSMLTALDIAKLPTYTTTPDDTVAHVARKMVKYNTYILPVCENDRPMGYVGMSDVLAIMLFEKEIVAKRTMEEVMRRYPIYVESGDSVIKLWNIMEEIQFSGVPVVSVTPSRRDKFLKLAGYVSKKDLLSSGNVRQALDANAGLANPPKVEKIMNRSPKVLGPHDTVSTFVEDIIRFDISRIPIVNEGYGLEGIVGKMDVLKLLVEGI